MTTAASLFQGEKTAWHGFDRYDFVMDEQTLAITPFQPPAGEGAGVKDPEKGRRRCIVVVPKEAAPGLPWSWRGCYWDHQPQTEIELLKRGFHVAYISANATLKPGKEWDAWYAWLTGQHGLSRKPAFIGMSRGGEYAYTWASAHADEVSCIYADNPGMNKEAFGKLGELARNDVPLLHVCGSIDPLLGRNSTAIENIYQQFGGRISVMIKEGFGHHPHSLRDPTPIADFISQSVQASNGAPPAFAGQTFTKSSFYGTESVYRQFPSEGTYITCRGPLFTECYNRYEFNVAGTEGTTTVIAPKIAAAGAPWVLRAGFVDRDAKVDLALLAKGFHIVTGPVPYNGDGPTLKDWNAVYKHLTDHGFSRKPVLQGAGGAAGDAYAWAIENPDQVSCIYGENPILRSKMSKTQPLDRLAPLAKAGVLILHVCGSLDPSLKDHTRVVEQRYKELGGTITVIVQEGDGHYPLAPKDVEPVIAFITQNAGIQAEPGHARAGDYQFDGTISRRVLENYLARAITMEGLLNGRGDLTDNIRMLKSIGAKYIGRALCLWNAESDFLHNIERAKSEMPQVLAADPEMILEACVFETVSPKVNQIAIPDWVFGAFGLPAEKRNFRYDDMIYPEGQRRPMGRNAQVPDESKLETQLWFYYQAASYIDIGCQAIHFGQVEIMNKNDPDNAHWEHLLDLVRAYAAKHAGRHAVLCNGHVPSGGLMRQGRPLLDFHAFPLRVMEQPDKPQEAILQAGFSDGIYGRSKGGPTFSGWTCEHLPYLVELDNWGVSRHPGEARAGGIWIWGYDEITWFAHQPKSYRADWLRYAWDWVRKTDTNGFLEMPGSRTESSPVDHQRWYYANNPSAPVPDGLGDEEAIRAIWEADSARN